MESKSSMLKKLAARITTANGDVSAVQGTSMSEIIKFMQENLNVVNGVLKVSKISRNLLSAPIMQDVMSWAGSYTHQVPKLGLVAGNVYRISGDYYERGVYKTFSFELVAATTESGEIAIDVGFETPGCSANEFQVGILVTDYTDRAEMVIHQEFSGATDFSNIQVLSITEV